MKDNIEKRVVGLFLVVFGVLVIVAVAAVRNIERAIASSDWVNHTHAVILEAEAIASSMHAGDAALRSFLLTGDPRDQTSYRLAYSEMVEHLEVAKALTRAEPQPRQQLAGIQTLLQKRLDFTRGLVKARQQGGLDAARKALAGDAGGETLRRIEHQIGQFKDGENALLRDRDKTSYLQAQTTRWTVLTGVALNFLLLVFVAWLMRDDLAARRRAARALEEANAQLEIKVQERTAELAQANQALQKENLERQWANQALQHQLRYNQLIINCVSDLVFVISRALNISRVNPAVTHRTGLEAAELIGIPMRRVLELCPEHPTEAAGLQDPMAIALKEGHEIQDCPAQLRNKAGQTTPVRFSLVPLRDQDKVVGGVITVSLRANGVQKPD
jgi:PAS domain S-box-containing protein